MGVIAIVNPVILVDTREQEPYSFVSCSPDNPPVEKRVALPTGDYSIEGLEGRITVERKSLDDFVNTVIKGKQRFIEELRRMQDYESACVVIEASIMDIVRQSYTSATHPHSVLGHIDSIFIDWGIPVYLCGDRQRAVQFVWGWLCREGEKVSSEGNRATG